MFLVFFSEVDRKGEQRSGDPIRGEAPLRNLATVVKTHEDADIDIAFVTSVGKQWAIRFDNKVVRNFGRRIKRHNAGITRQMMQDLFGVLDHALFGQTRLLLVIKTAMMSALANEFRRSELFLKVGHFNPNLGLSRGNATFFNASWDRVQPGVAALEQLERDGGLMLHRPPALKNGPRGEIFGGSPTSFPLGPFGKRGAFCVAPGDTCV